MLKIAALLALCAGVLGILELDHLITAGLTFVVAAMILVSLSRGGRRQ